jgi:hypothetical protein
MARTRYRAPISASQLRPTSQLQYAPRRQPLHGFVKKRLPLEYFEVERGAKAACHSAVASAQAGELLRNTGILQEVCKHLVGHSLYVSLVCKA